MFEFKSKRCFTLVWEIRKGFKDIDLKKKRLVKAAIARNFEYRIMLRIVLLCKKMLFRFYLSKLNQIFSNVAKKIMLLLSIKPNFLENLQLCSY